MRDNTALGRINNVQLLILEEPLSVVNVPLQVGHAFVDLTLRFTDWLAHFLGDQSCIGRLVLPQNVLKVAQFLESTLQS